MNVSKVLKYFSLFMMVWCLLWALWYIVDGDSLPALMFVILLGCNHLCYRFWDYKTKDD